jgi:hypothetical protein
MLFCSRGWRSEGLVMARRSPGEKNPCWPENEESEEEKEEEVSDGDGLTSDEELQHLNSEHEDQDEDTEELPDLESPQPKRQAGSWVVALYEGDWFLCAVMADQEGVASSYTKLHGHQGEECVQLGGTKNRFSFISSLVCTISVIFFVPVHLGHEHIF